MLKFGHFGDDDVPRIVPEVLAKIELPFNEHGFVSFPVFYPGGSETGIHLYTEESRGSFVTRGEAGTFFHCVVQMIGPDMPESKLTIYTDYPAYIEVFRSSFKAIDSEIALKPMADWPHGD